MAKKKSVVEKVTSVSKKDKHRQIISELNVHVDQLDGESTIDYRQRKNEAQKELRYHMKQLKLWNRAKKL